MRGKGQVARALVAQQHHAGRQAQNRDDPLQNRVEMLAGVKQCAEQPREGVERLDAAIMPLQCVEEPRIFDRRGPLGGQGQAEAHVVDRPVMNGRPGRDDEADDTARSRQGQEGQRADVKPLDERGRHQG